MEEKMLSRETAVSQPRIRGKGCFLFSDIMLNFISTEKWIFVVYSGQHGTWMLMKKKP